ncbi:MAG TPA: quinone-dependent dihydroorotate dehydrogenase, partial [Jiangellales bacterium]|nr:quinone-dependent dihydroorotate dehydrogenase [Jiangellales bacterium]
MRVYDGVFRNVISHVDAELAHKWSFQTLRAVTSIRAGERLVSRICSVPALPVRAMGLRFPNPLGLAAGFDKDAAGIDGLAALGFGFIEVGTVTARPQPGNPRPRLFRLARDQAIVNRMGFNNAGAAAAAERLRRRKSRPGTGRPTIVGVNIGKTRSTPVEHAIDDYIVSTRLLAPHADYLVVNVSSPNTPGLRDLQAVDRLGPLLDAVRHAAVQVTQRRVPLLVKISPDLDDDDIGDIAGLAL